MKNTLFNLRVTAGKYFWSLSENIFVIRKYFTCDRKFFFLKVKFLREKIEKK